MIIVYRDNQFEKCLEQLKRAGGTGAQAARRVEALIEELASSDGRAAETCRLTRNGEARIRKCIKFDLGDGYRLVCIRQGLHLVFLHAGSHDDCDRWLEHNRGLRPDVDPEPLIASPVERHEESPPPSGPDHGPDDDYEAGLRERLTEKELRSLFNGLCG